MNKQISNEILNELRTIITKAESELDFKNNFELLCAVMLSAQTTDKRVNMATPFLFKQYPDAKTLKNAKYDDILELIKSLGLAKTKAKNIIALSQMIDENFNGQVPNTMEELMTLPGVGRKTASVVLAVGFGIPAFPVDTHLHRMAFRLGYASEKSSVEEAEAQYRKYIDESEWIEAHHLLLLFGRYHCKAIHPLCEVCPVIKYCKVKK